MKRWVRLARLMQHAGDVPGVRRVLNDAERLLADFTVSYRGEGDPELKNVTERSFEDVGGAGFGARGLAQRLGGVGDFLLQNPAALAGPNLERAAGRYEAERAVNRLGPRPISNDDGNDGASSVAATPSASPPDSPRQDPDSEVGAQDREVISISSGSEHGVPNTPAKPPAQSPGFRNWIASPARAQPGRQAQEIAPSPYANGNPNRRRRRNRTHIPRLPVTSTSASEDAPARVETKEAKPRISRVEAKEVNDIYARLLETPRSDRRIQKLRNLTRHSRIMRETFDAMTPMGRVTFINAWKNNGAIADDQNPANIDSRVWEAMSPEAQAAVIRAWRARGQSAESADGEDTAFTLASLRSLEQTNAMSPNIASDDYRKMYELLNHLAANHAPDIPMPQFVADLLNVCAINLARTADISADPSHRAIQIHPNEMDWNVLRRHEAIWQRYQNIDPYSEEFETLLQEGGVVVEATGQRFGFLSSVEQVQDYVNKLIEMSKKNVDDAQEAVGVMSFLMYMANRPRIYYRLMGPLSPNADCTLFFLRFRGPSILLQMQTSLALLTANMSISSSSRASSVVIGDEKPADQEPSSAYLYDTQLDVDSDGLSATTASQQRTQPNPTTTAAAATQADQNDEESDLLSATTPEPSQPSSSSSPNIQVISGTSNEDLDFVLGQLQNDDYDALKTNKPDSKRSRSRSKSASRPKPNLSSTVRLDPDDQNRLQDIHEESDGDTTVTNPSRSPSPRRRPRQRKKPSKPPQQPQKPSNPPRRRERSPTPPGAQVTAAAVPAARREQHNEDMKDVTLWNMTDDNEEIRKFITAEMRRLLDPGRFVDQIMISRYFYCLQRYNYEQLARPSDGRPRPPKCLLISPYVTTWIKTVIDEDKIRTDAAKASATASLVEYFLLLPHTNKTEFQDLKDEGKLMDHRYILIPLFYPRHWTLGVIDTWARTYSVLNSLEHPDYEDYTLAEQRRLEAGENVEVRRRAYREEYFNNNGVYLRQLALLIQILKDNDLLPRGGRRWIQGMFQLDPPPQQDGADCGVFVCEYARCIVQSVADTPVKLEVDNTRKAMAAVRKRIHDDIEARRIRFAGTKEPRLHGRGA